LEREADREFLGRGAGAARAGQEKGVPRVGAPTVVNSPQFAFMAKTLADKKLGRLAGAHATYGWTGPNWASFFYAEGVAACPIWASYNLTSLTGLLGPAKSVTAMTASLPPTRDITGKGEFR